MNGFSFITQLQKGKEADSSLEVEYNGSTQPPVQDEEQFSSGLILATPLSKIKILQENQTHPSKKAFQQPLVATQAVAPTPNIDAYIHILRVLTEAFLSLTQDIFPEGILDRYGFPPFTLPGSFSTSER